MRVLHRRVRAQAKEIVKFIRGHHYSLYLWREHAEHELLLPAETRFATSFIMADRLHNEKQSAVETVADRKWAQWLNGTLEGKKKRKKSYYAEATVIKTRINNDAWWDKLALIMEIVTPIVELLKHGDSELPIMGKVYARMGAIAAKLDDSDFAPDLTPQQRREIVRIHADRWQYLHNHYHAAGYVLDPEFADDPHHTNAEVMRGFQTVCDRLFHDDQSKANKAKQQRSVYARKAQGIFGQRGTWDHAKTMAAHEWWLEYGYELPELQYVALRVLSKRSSACSVERLWSLFGRVWSDERARLGAQKATDLVKAGSNLRLQSKLLTIDYETQMRSWLDPEDSDDEDDEDGGEADGARAAAANAED